MKSTRRIFEKQCEFIINNRLISNINFILEGSKLRLDYNEVINVLRLFPFYTKLQKIQTIRRVLDVLKVCITYVGIYLSSLNVTMSQNFLNESDISSVF